MVHQTIVQDSASLQKRKSPFLHWIFISLLLVNCDGSEPKPLTLGRVAFSFSSADLDNGRTNEVTPAFVSYTLEKPDGSTISDKIELIAFNENFVTQPQDLLLGQYELIQFIIQDATNAAIYAAPLEGSEMADLVEEPLPLSFTIDASEITNVVPQVLALGNHSAEDFGYVVFGFEIVETISFDVSATIADLATHNTIDYTLEIIAKDAPLGNIKWTKTVSLHKLDEIEIPSQHQHYTFRAIKPDYIPHVQHFLLEELSTFSNLSFEFIPESLDGFTMKDHGHAKIYFPNDLNRCKLYARIDVAEGFLISEVYVDKNGVVRKPVNGSIQTYFLEYISYDCIPGEQTTSACGRNVNIFNNTPFAQAQNYCDYTPSWATLNYVDIASYLYYTYYEFEQTGNSHFGDEYKFWKGADTPD